MLRRVSCCLGFLVLLMCLMGASSITLTATPNPKGAAQKLDGDGNYTVDPQEMYGDMTYLAFETTTKQVSVVKTTVDPMKLTWTATLNLVAGTYDAEVKMTTIDANKKSIFTKATKNGVVVK